MWIGLGAALALVGLVLSAAGCGGFGVDHRLLSAKEEAVLHAQTRPGLVWPKAQNPRNIEVRGDIGGIPMSHFPNYFVFPEIDGKKRRFLVDTGAWTCMLDPYAAMAHKVPLVPGGSCKIGTVSGTASGVLGILPHMKLGSLEIQDTPVLISTASLGYQVFWIQVGRLDGILGNSFFSSFVCTFDAKEKTLTLRLPRTFDPARDLPDLIDTIPFKLDPQGHIALTVRIAGQDRPAILDFGAQSPLGLPLAWAQELKILLKGTDESTSLGGKAYAPKGGPVTVGIGKAEAELAVLCPSGLSDSAVIGDRFFHVYRLTVDYPNNKLYIEKRVN